MKHQLTALLIVTFIGVVSGCGIPPRSAGQSEWRGRAPGPASSSGRKYERMHVREDWTGVRYSELVAHWGEPESRFYEDEFLYEEERVPGVLGPTAHYVEVVRDPYGGRPGQFESIYFVLTEDFLQIRRIYFGGPYDWDGRDVEIDIYDHW